MSRDDKIKANNKVEWTSISILLTVIDPLSPMLSAFNRKTRQKIGLKSKRRYAKQTSGYLKAYQLSDYSVITNGACTSEKYQKLIKRLLQDPTLKTGFASHFGAISDDFLLL